MELDESHVPGFAEPRFHDLRHVDSAWLYSQTSGVELDSHRGHTQLKSASLGTATSLGLIAVVCIVTFVVAWVLVGPDAEREVFARIAIGLALALFLACSIQFQRVLAAGPHSRLP